MLGIIIGEGILRGLLEQSEVVDEVLVGQRFEFCFNYICNQR